MSFATQSKTVKKYLLVFGFGLFNVVAGLVNASSIEVSNPNLAPILGEADHRCFNTDAAIDGVPLLAYLNRLSSSAEAFKMAKRANGSEAPISNNKITEQWFHFCLHNSRNERHDLVIEVGPPTLSEIDFYPQMSDKQIFRTGSSRGVNTRDVPYAGFAFKASLEPNQRQSFLLRIDASGNPFYRRADIAENPFFQTRVWDRDSFDSNSNKKEIIFGIISGVFLALAIYNLLLFIAARQWTSLLYIALISCIFIVLLALNGRLVQFAPPNIPQFSNRAIAIFYPLTAFFSALFLRAFIKLKDYPKLNSAGNVIIVLCTVSLFLSYAYNQTLFAKLCDVVGVVVSVYFGVFAPVYAFVKDRLIVAKYVLITLSPMIFCLIDRALFSFGVTDQYYVPYKIVTGAMFAMILISYFMGLIAYREKQAAMRTALEQLNISNTLKSNYNTQLEQELLQKTTDIRSMNEDLELKANKLLQLDESKSRFFANISHEFRTPLTLIEGPLTMLLEREGFPEKTVLAGMLRNSNTLKNLIDQILLLSELDENSLDLKARELSIVPTVTELVSQFESAFEQKGIQLRCQARQHDIHAYVDFEKLQIILNNLLSNAIKFTESGGEVNVEVTSTVANTKLVDESGRDEYVEILVSDTGHGIPEHELAHVFDRYFQSDSSELSKSGIGTGIGLALVKELVELHGGDVSVESNVLHEDSLQQSGTRFRITLPLGKAHLSENEIVCDATQNSEEQIRLLEKNQHQDHPTETVQKSGGGKVEESKARDDRNIGLQKTVLVVDDNNDMRQHIRRLLENEYHILTANDGLFAEQVLKKNKPDLIVTDLMMPNRNGLEFVKSIKQQESFANIPVIMLTARAGLHDRIQGLMAAVDDYMIKPFNGRELRLRIQNLLNKHAQFEAFYHAAELPSDEGQEAPESQYSNSFIEKAKRLVDQHLADASFGVGQLADALYCSEATLRRRLLDQANFTPAAFIRHCRLERARQLALKNKPKSIAQLAQSVGFSHATYFARLYEKTFNQKIDIAVK